MLNRRENPFFIVPFGQASVPEYMARSLQKIDQETALLHCTYQSVTVESPTLMLTVNLIGRLTMFDEDSLHTLGVQGRVTIGDSVETAFQENPNVLHHIRHALAGESVTAIVQEEDRILKTCYLPNYDANSQVNGMMCVAMNVTERIQAEETLKASEYVFRTLAELSYELCIIVDAQGVVKYANPAHRIILGYEPDEMLGKNIFSFIHPADKRQSHLAWNDVFAGTSSLAHVECRFRHANGSWLHAEAFGRDRRDDPAIQGLIVTSRDITERVNLECHLREQALTDPLTELPNHRAVMLMLEHEYERAHRLQRPLSILFVDGDHFKHVNDTYGHVIGDVVLAELGQRLREALRAGDEVGRFGGEEFVVLLPETDCEEAVQIAERLRNAVAAMPLACAQVEGGIPTTISLGIATYPNHAEAITALLDQADQAMYHAKQAGRNQAYTANEAA